MTTIENIRAEVERLYAKYKAKYDENRLPYCEGLIDGLDLVEQFLDTLEAEAPEGLKEAANTIPLKLLTENKESYTFDSTGMRFPKDCFKAGAKWMEEKK